MAHLVKPITPHADIARDCDDPRRRLRPMLPLLAIMFSVLLIVTCFPDVFMWIPRLFGFASWT